MTELKKVTVEEWTTALRSGKYKQAKHVLKCDAGFCCLGVLADLAGGDWQPDTGLQTSYPGAQKFLGPNKISYYATIDRKMLPIDVNPMVLAGMNDDDDGKSFNEIADYIEAVAKEQNND